MRIETIYIYEYDELSYEAKNKARQDWLDQEDTTYINREFEESLKGFNKAFPLLSILRINWDREELDDTDGNAYILEHGDLKDCPFTGCCYDEGILEPIRKRYKELKEGATDKTDLYALREACLQAFNSARASAVAYHLSDENAEESIRINGYEFLSNGKMY